MKQVSIHHAKTHLSRLIEEAAAGDPFVIAKAGQPMVEVRAVPDRPQSRSRIGFLKEWAPPTAPIKEVGRAEIETMFGLDDSSGTAAES